MDFFDRATEKEAKNRDYPRSVEIFVRKKGRSSKRYGTKRPIEKTDKQELLTAWRGDL